MIQAVTKAITKRQEEVLLRVLDYIKQEPKRFNMHSWGEIFPKFIKDWNGNHIPNPDKTYKAGRKRLPIPPCNTAACLAGTVLLVTKKGKRVIAKEKKGCEITETISFSRNTPEIAKEILGFTEQQSNSLFYLKNWGLTEPIRNENGFQISSNRIGWPIQFSKAYNQAKTGKERYKALEARVKYFIRTGL